MFLTIIFVYCLVTWLIGSCWVLEIDMLNWEDRLMSVGFIILAPAIVPIVLVWSIIDKYL